MLENAKLRYDDNFITKIHKISAKEKYNKTEFLRCLIAFYAENKNLLEHDYALSQGYRKMGRLNLKLAENNFDSLVLYEDYIASLDEITTKTINEEYNNERS